MPVALKDKINKSPVPCQEPGSCIISTPQWLAGDRQIRCISAGSGDPAGADCGIL